jgi:glycosyltransferase involved in cell wall biosynthesis
MTSPAVSIILPTFNRLEYLRPAVDSVFSQTFTDWELIVADDGSEAETVAFLAALADRPRARVLRLPHTGNVPAVRNAALQAARGEYIAFLDSDDVWVPEKLALQVASLRAHPERGWSHTAFAAIDESGNLLTGARARWWPAAEGWILEKLVRMEVVIAISSVLVTQELLEQLGGFDPEQRVCEDYDLWLRLAGVSEIDGVRETLLHKRSHPASYYDSAMVFENLSRALTKLLAADSDRALHPMLGRERAKLAASLAHSQAVCGSRWAALRTLLRSSKYSWAYREWWMGGAHAAARAMAPEGILRIARSVVRRIRRSRGATQLQE